MNKTITKPDVERVRVRPAHSQPQPAIAFLWSRTGRLKEAWELVRAIAAWPGAGIVPDRGGLCLTVNGVRLGHLLWNGRIDLPFGPEAAAQLVAEKMAVRDPSGPHTGRVVFDLRSAEDVDRALALFGFAYLTADSSAAAQAGESRGTANASCV
jgi:hypothetical protein